LQARERGGEGGDELRRGGLVERGLAECAERRQRSPVRLLTQPLRLAQQVRKHAHGASEGGVVQRAAQRGQVLGGGEGAARLLYGQLLGPARVACEPGGNLVLEGVDFVPQGNERLAGGFQRGHARLSTDKESA